MTQPDTCPGPIIWFDVQATSTEDPAAAVLECATCGYVITTGNFHDEAHAETELMREGIAS